MFQRMSQRPKIQVLQRVPRLAERGTLDSMQELAEPKQLSHPMQPVQLGEAKPRKPMTADSVIVPLFGRATKSFSAFLLHFSLPKLLSSVSVSVLELGQQAASKNRTLQTGAVELSFGNQTV